MNYGRTYDDLMRRAIARASVEGYSELHHIAPRCLGGSDEQENLVRLTAREHFVAHLLLVKMHPGNRKLVLAVQCMTRGNGDQLRTSRAYGWVREAIADTCRSIRHSDETKIRMSETRRLNPPTPEHLSKMRAAQGSRKGQTSPMKGRVMSPEARAKIAAAHRGRKRSPEHVKNMSLAQLARHSAPQSATP